MQTKEFDFLIIGAGIIGLFLAKNIKDRYKDAKVAIIEKESDVAKHSSGRNSGVLHAGFYYTKDSLKAKFTSQGNRYLKEFVKSRRLKINECQKIVVAKDEKELDTLFELQKRGEANNSNLRVIDDKELSKIEPNAKTYKYALLSPNTATIDPVEISLKLKEELINEKIEFYFNNGYKQNLKNNTILTSQDLKIKAKKIINAAGLYADKIAKDFGFSKDYVIIPFKGIYLKANRSYKPIVTNIYPVPDLKNPFLGVHFTATVDNDIKIGPTAIPAFWRENYSGLDNFKLNEFLEILYYESKLFFTNSFNFRELAFEEIKKYKKSYFLKLGSKLVKDLDMSRFDEWSRPGIRAQLLNRKTLELLQDFVVEGDKKSIHILNTVSPAFTSSYPFTKWVVDKFI